MWAAWRARALAIASVLVLGMGLGGCVSFSYTQDPVEQALLVHSPEKALKALESRNLIGRDKVLYNLDKGMLLRMQGDFEGSNASFEIAKRAMEKLEAVSVTEQVGAVAINDTLRGYSGPLFERVLLHAWMALNFLELGKSDSARIEMMQMDVLMKEQGAEHEVPSVRYLAGVVFETLGEWSDALIAYRKAYEACRKHGMAVPSHLQADLLRLTRQQGLDDEHRRFQEEFALKDWRPQEDYRRNGELIVVLGNGLVPRKHEQAINAQDPSSGQLHRIATPFYETRTADVQGMQVRAAGQRQKGEVMDALDRHAQDALSQEMPGIVARALARVVVKNRAADEARRKDPLVGLVVNVAGFVTERADTRGWYTLPQQIMIARVLLPEGEHDIGVELQDRSGRSVVKEYADTRMVSGQKRLISLHWPASQANYRRPAR